MKNKDEDKIPIHKCYWINQKDEPCPWNSLSPEKNFCKRHSMHEGVFTKEDIKKLSKCSGCKNRFLPDPELNNKTCDKCNKRCETIRKKEKEEKEKNPVKKCLKCIEMKREIPLDALENDNYCGKHQSYKKWKILIDSGKNVCKNWIRGCFEIIDSDKKSCSKCRKKEQEDENKNNTVKKNKAIKFNEENEGKKENAMCHQCNKIVKEDNIVNNKCLECYDAYRKVEQNRNPQDPLIKHLLDYKSRCKKNNIDWELTDEEAKDYFNSKCVYCNTLTNYNGIDRIDSNIGYIKENSVACCSTCNFMKGTKTVDEFLKIVKYILAINLKIFIPLNSDIKKLFVCSNNSKYYRFVCECRNRDINNKISEEMYDFIITQPCNYCKNTFENGCRGIDRINSSTGYIIGNITPCCYTCNVMKNVLSTELFFEQLQKIYNFKVLNKINTEDKNIREKILEMCKNVKPFEHEKFRYNHEYYKNLVFTPENINDVKKIKIELEFIIDRKQKDIWNYYRRYVSSLKVQKSSKLIGRQIHILVKDKITKKYLGIMSLSSDAYNFEVRDKYIGWNVENKKSNLKLIMNMSTCVGLQPLSFNYNVGKLLASLVFSKEVLNYFKEKYDEPLLAITTTSLYGKSVQYDRLKNLKYLGTTKGHSSYKVPSEVTKLCNDFLKKEYNYNYDFKKKFIILQKTFDKLNLPKEDILVDNPKGIYFGFTYPESKKILKSKNKENENYILTDTSIKTAAEIFDWWVERWATQRYENLVKNNNLKINKNS